MEKFRGKTALITGAGSGIGREIAVRFSKMGIVCALVGRREDALQRTAEMIGAENGKSFVFACDITNMEEQKELVEKIISQTGSIDIVVNNAGVTLGCPFEEVTEKQYDDVMAINVKAPFMLCQNVLPYLRKSECATIINIASVVAHKGYKNQSIYATSKHALLGLSKVLAAELFEENIRVHVISPGGVYTDMVSKVRPDLSPEGMILAQDIADAAVFFLEHRFTNAVVDEIEVHRAGKQPFL